MNVFEKSLPASAEGGWKIGGGGKIVFWFCLFKLQQFIYRAKGWAWEGAFGIERAWVFLPL